MLWKIELILDDAHSCFMLFLSATLNVSFLFFKIALLLARILKITGVFFSRCLRGNSHFCTASIFLLILGSEKVAGLIHLIGYLKMQAG